MERIQSQKNWEEIFREQSPYLSKQNGYNINSIVDWSKPSIESALITITGDSKGFYKKSGEWHMAFIPFVEARLEEMKKAYESFQQDAKRQGKEVPLLPPEMEARMNKLSAQLVVLNEERTVLEGMLKDIAAKEEKEEELHCLEYGLKQSGRLQDGILVSLDGQRIVQDEDGLLIIDSGIYKGMDVPSYRKLAAQWRKDRDAADAAKLLRLQQEARESNKPVPNILTFTSKKVDPRNLPPFPAWAKNHYEKK
jgi:hypothetical protein